MPYLVNQEELLPGKPKKSFLTNNIPALADVLIEETRVAAGSRSLTLPNQICIYLFIHSQNTYANSPTMVKFSSLLWLVALSFYLSSFTASAQTTDTLRRSGNSDLARDPIFNLGRRSFTDTVRRGEFKEYNGTLTEITDCDTTLQTFVFVRRPSPWKAGIYLGPNFAYCGTWENTFGSTPRDQTLYNGTGLNFTANLDYYFSRPERAFRFGVGTAFGYQNYFTRSGYKDYILTLADQQGIPRGNVEYRQRASEDMFITVGPVVTLNIARSRKYPSRVSYIELGARGGLFRTEAATIVGFVPNQTNRLIRSVNPSTNVFHLGGLLSLGVFFPIAANWQLGLQAQGFYTNLNYLIVNGQQVNQQSQVFEFSRKHGGFNVGLGLRKTFNEKRLIPKAPVACPECDSMPVLAVRYNNMRFNGRSLGADSLIDNTMPVISWHSTTIRPRNETFTARLHYKAANADSVIAQVVNTTDTTLAFPRQYMDGQGRPRPGFYYVTVHNRQEAPCGACMSEVAVTSFAFPFRENNDKLPPPCTYTNQLDRLEVYYRNPLTREVSNVCYCNGEITSVSAPTTKLRFQSLNKRLAGSYTFQTTQPDLNLSELPAELSTQLKQEKTRIESGKAVKFKNRRVRPEVQYFRAVFTVTQDPCNGQPAQTLGSFTTTISDATYKVTDLKPLTEEQRTKLLTPAAPSRRRR